MTTVRSARSAAAAGLALLVVAALGGCGGPPPKVDVTGTVKLKGKPPGFHGLEIVFQSADGTLTSGDIQEDGTYTAPGVPAGETQVFFSYVTPENAAEAARYKSGAGRLKRPGQAASEPPRKPTGKEPARSPIPEDLREASTSKLTYKVEAGKPNVFDYDLP